MEDKEKYLNYNRMRRRQFNRLVPSECFCGADEDEFKVYDVKPHNMEMDRLREILSEEEYSYLVHDNEMFGQKYECYANRGMDRHRVVIGCCQRCNNTLVFPFQPPADVEFTEENEIRWL